MDEIIIDFIRRSRSHYTVDQVKKTLQDNLSLITRDGFICFNIVQDECYILFCYTRPGVDVKPYQYAAEFYAKKHGCKRIAFLTNREKAFQRKFKDYHPTARLFEKELI